MQTNNEVILRHALNELIQWAAGNRGSKSGNPYLIPEVMAGMQTLAKSMNKGLSAWLDADSIYEKGQWSQMIREYTLVVDVRSPDKGLLAAKGERVFKIDQDENGWLVVTPRLEHSFYVQQKEITHFTPTEIAWAREFWGNLSDAECREFYVHYTTGRGKGSYNDIDENTSYEDYLVISAYESEADNIFDR